MKKRAFLCGGLGPGFHSLLNGVREELEAIFAEDFELAETGEDYQGKTACDLRRFDCLILYSAPFRGVAGDSDFAASLIDYTVNGGSVLILHFIATGVFDEGAQVFGGRFRMHPPYSRCRIEPAPVCHPILEGIGPFEINDEMHQLFTEEFLDKTILLNCLNDDGSPRARGPLPHQDIYAKNSGVRVPMAWCHEFGLGRVLYSCPGHSAETFRNAEYRRFLARCGKWLIRGL